MFNMKIFSFIIGGLLILIAIALFLPGSNEESVNNKLANRQTQTTEVSDQDLIIGDRNAPVSLIEYADFKCPSCNQFHQVTAPQLKEEYVDKGQVNIVFRPLNVIGPDSERSAIGAYCAADQGKFEPYHDLIFNYLFENFYVKGNLSAEFDDVLTKDKLKELILPLGIEIAAFESCLDSQESQQNIERNVEFANRDGVRGTPNFKLGSQLISGPQSFDNFKTLIDIQLR